MQTPFLKPLKKDRNKEVVRDFKLVNTGVFDEMLDYLTMFLVWHDMPKELTLEVGVPESALVRTQAQNILQDYRIFSAYIKRLIPTATVLPPKPIKQNHIHLKIIL